MIIKKHFLQRETTLFVANVLLIFFFSPDVAFLMRKMGHIPMSETGGWIWYSMSALVLEVVILMAVANGSETTGKVISIASFFLSNYYYLIFDSSGQVITIQTINFWLILPSLTLSAYRAAVIYNMAGIWKKIHDDKANLSLPDPKVTQLELELSKADQRLSDASALALRWQIKYYESSLKAARSDKAKNEIEITLNGLKNENSHL